MEIELKLGSEFYADGAKLVATEGKGCDNCFFYDDPNCGYLACMNDCRKDKTDVIFVEADEE